MDDGARGGAFQVPSTHRLRAALRAASVLNPNGTPVDALRAAYVELPLGGVFYSEDLVAGEMLLRAGALVTENGGQLRPTERLLEIQGLDDAEACELLLLMLLMDGSPLWLSAASHDGELHPEVIPEDATRTLREVLPDLDRREAVLLALAQRHDETARAALGALGEEYIVAACQDRLRNEGRGDLAAEVRRVSKISDQLGYDVTERRPCGRAGRYEVKTTRSLGQVVEIHISRNEARTGLRDPDWAMVICRVDRAENVSVVGWCRARELEEKLPSDAEDGGRWESAVARIDVDQTIKTGLPPL